MIQVSVILAPMVHNVRTEHVVQKGCAVAYCIVAFWSADRETGNPASGVGCDALLPVTRALPPGVCADH